MNEFVSEIILLVKSSNDTELHNKVEDLCMQFAKRQCALFSEFRDQYMHIEKTNMRQLLKEKYGKSNIGVTYELGEFEKVWDSFTSGKQLKRYYEGTNNKS